MTRLSLRCLVCCSAFVGATGAARAAEFALVPVRADQFHVVRGNEIILSSGGGGARVTLEVRLSDGAPAATGNRCWMPGSSRSIPPATPAGSEDP